MMARPRRKLGKAKGIELAAERRLADRDAEGVPNPSGQVQQPPPHDLVDLRVRPAFDRTGKCGTLRIIELRGRAGRFARYKPIGAF